MLKYRCQLAEVMYMESNEQRSKAARRIIVRSGMRVGRMGMGLSVLGLALILGTRLGNLPAAPLLLLIGLGAVVVGLFPFAIGWSQSRQGAPFLRALTEEGSAKVLLMDPQVLPGNRRSLALLLADNTRQTVALPETDAQEVLSVIRELSPDAEVGVREAAQRAVAQLQVA